MRVVPDREKKQIVIEMTEREWLYFEASMTLPIMKPSDRTEETVAEIATIEPEVIEPKDYIIPENAILLKNDTPKEPSKPKKTTPRVERLFPGFKKPEAGKVAAKGLLSVKCDTCGKRTIINAREPITELECRTCGGNTEFLEPFKRVGYVCHKCGHDGYIHTNHNESINLKCKMCGEPVRAQ